MCSSGFAVYVCVECESSRPMKCVSPCRVCPERQVMVELAAVFGGTSVVVMQAMAVEPVEVT